MHNLHCRMYHKFVITVFLSPPWSTLLPRDCIPHSICFHSGYVRRHCNVPHCNVTISSIALEAIISRTKDILFSVLRDHDQNDAGDTSVSSPSLRSLMV